MDVGVRTCGTPMSNTSRVEFDDTLINNSKSIKNGGWIQDVLEISASLA
jgi:hypothetical protein